MNVRLKFALSLVALFAGIVAVVAVVGVMIAAGLPDAEYAFFMRIVRDRAPVLGFVAVLLLFACAGLLGWLFTNHVTAVRSLAEQTRIVFAANSEHRVVSSGGAELVELAATINRLADAYHRERNDLEARAGATNARLEEERNRLAALMSELAEGVLLCNTEGRILLYNEKAKALFGAAAPGTRQGLVGLGRSVFALLDRDQVAHALDKLQSSLDQGVEFPASRFITNAVTGALIQVQMAAFLSAGGRIAGMVLTLADVTELMGREAQRRSLLQAFAAGVRAPVANLRAAAENLVSFPEMNEARRVQFTEIVAAESRQVSAMINDALSEYADALKAGLALEDMRAADLLSVAQRRIEAVLGLPCGMEHASDEIWIKVDSFALVEALAYLAGRLREDYGVRSVGLRAAENGRFAELDLVWSGAIVGSEALSLWETEPMQIGGMQTPLTLKDVLERHGGEAWVQSHKTSHTAWFRLLLPLGAPASAAVRSSVAMDSRPEYYDFDLFGHADKAPGLAERKLVDLHYTVFDTETTGLEPSAGDEIISLGAVRIVNGRLLKREVFEQLVDPKRPVSKASARIHGIEAKALKGQPTIGEVLPQFHHFCEDTVLVAHNAAFDMRFLELKEAATGVRFTQPILDTLLLSVVLHPTQEGHSIEAVAERLGVSVIGRHTALGDALVTGEIFLKLLPLLAEHGILTLGQALEASRATYHARLQY
ncbi:MAG: DNA polymerase III subunit epsilon [Burkholderiales bacterium]|nr:DNA polymerase III subunit epsilon [Burkholderiales bacterium]